MKTKLIILLGTLGCLFSVNGFNIGMHEINTEEQSDNIDKENVEERFQERRTTEKEVPSIDVEEYTVNYILYVFSTVDMDTEDIVVRTENDIKAMYFELTGTYLTEEEYGYLNSFIVEYNNQNPLVYILYSYGNSMLYDDEALINASTEELYEEYKLVTGNDLSEENMELLIDYINTLK